MLIREQWGVVADSEPRPPPPPDGVLRPRWNLVAHVGLAGHVHAFTHLPHVVKYIRVAAVALGSRVAGRVRGHTQGSHGCKWQHVEWQQDEAKKGVGLGWVGDRGVQGNRWRRVLGCLRQSMHAWARAPGRRKGTG